MGKDLTTWHKRADLDFDLFAFTVSQFIHVMTFVFFEPDRLLIGLFKLEYASFIFG